jgi:hypothetical protein
MAREGRPQQPCAMPTPKLPDLTGAPETAIGRT